MNSITRLNEIITTQQGIMHNIDALGEIDLMTCQSDKDRKRYAQHEIALGNGRRNLRTWQRELKDELLRASGK